MKDSCIILIIKAENFVFLSKMSLCYTFIKHDFTRYSGFPRCVVNSMLAAEWKRGSFALPFYSKGN